MNRSLKRLSLLSLVAAALGACDGAILTPIVRGEGGGDVPVGPEPKLPDPECVRSGEVGRVTLHRLNRIEYDNTLRDLLGISGQPSAQFPSDDTLGGFDNNAEGLTVSSLLVEKHEAAVRDVVARTAHTIAAKACDPLRLGIEACGTQSLAPFVQRAWRRPPTREELTGLLTYVKLAVDQGDGFERGLALAMQAALLSPSFLYRVEADPDPTGATAQRISDFELASRLSYFLWSSMPDDELLRAAGAGELQDTARLEAQVRRMLDNPRADALAEGLAGQWLYGRVVQVASPDPLKYALDGPLRSALVDEAKLLLRAYLTQDLNGLDVLASDFTFLNARLATHYGVPGTYGDAMLRVDLSTFPQRGGLLTLGGVHAATSSPVETKPIRRGVWVLSNLLCSPPGPPPDAAFQVIEMSKANADPNASVRERMAAHRAIDGCIACHASIDPIGLSMENYDVVGAWRTKDGVHDIDASGQLPSGETFNGARELGAVLRNKPAFASCMTQTLARYALGRLTTPEDACELEQMTAATKKDGFRLRDLVVRITSSEMFRSRKGEQQ